MSASDVIGILSFALHAAHKIYSVAQSIRKASDEIERLKAEALRVQSLLNHVGIKTSAAEHRGEDISLEELSLQIELSGKAEELVASANKFIKKATLLTSDGTPRVNKIRWPFRASEAKHLAEDFQTFHRTLTDVCTINTL